MKKLNKYSLLLLLILSAGHIVFGQDTLRLTHREFLAVVKNYHPLAFRYRLQNRMAEAEIQKARGNFDPQLNGKNGAKTIDGLDYYQETNVGLDIPTWYGVELNGNYTHLDGQKLNNSDTRGGLYQFGITLPIAKNLLYDKRRAMLDQAKFALQMTAAEQQLLTNQLLLDADNAYWTWVKTHDAYTLQKQAVEINRQRLELIRKTYEYGERAAIDTTEALSQLQSFELQLEDVFLAFIKSTQELSLFLWTENQQPYDIPFMLFPVEKIIGNTAYDEYSTMLMQMENQAMTEHAAMQFYFQKQNILESERRLKWQSFLPKLDLTYNFFNKESYSSKYFPLFRDNYQYGVKLEIPLFLRQARADYQIIKAKIQQNQLDADFKLQELNAKITSSRNEVLNYKRQIDIAQQNIQNYRRLLNAEEQLFSNGESSLFLINSRENKLLESELKLLDLRLKFVSSYNNLKWLNENFRND
ncbi:TolC family protein [Gynurincola endophyticus]|uniref:TolC family protein n=1 Tax=Gynurincola endophyticus TaxID=2479004 RepID=UPI000F8D8582|nr:TolC family protein [Gynurincola endophyticus]